MKRTHLIDINREWAKEVGRSEAIKQLTDAYPGIDIGAEYDKIVPPQDKKAEKSQKEG